MTGPDLTMLRMIIDNDRIKFLGLRQKLMAKLAPFNASAETPDHLIAYAEELGTDAAIDKLAKDPKHFRIDVPPAVRKEITPLVRAIIDISYDLDRMVAERENILVNADPTRRRVYISYGREFTMDMRKGTITYLDTPDKTEPLNLQVVHTKDQPDPGRHFPGRSNDKNRGRS